MPLRYRSRSRATNLTAAGSGCQRDQKPTQRGLRVNVPCIAIGMTYPRLNWRSSQSDSAGISPAIRRSYPCGVVHGAKAFSTRPRIGASSGTCRRMIADMSVASIQAMPSGVYTFGV